MEDIVRAIFEEMDRKEDANLRYLAQTGLPKTGKQIREGVKGVSISTGATYLFLNDLEDEGYVHRVKVEGKNRQYQITEAGFRRVKKGGTNDSEPNERRN